MAIFEIKPADSVIAFGDAFSYDSPDPDTLIVDAGAFLFSTAGSGAELANTGTWTVTVNGSIFGDVGSRRQYPLKHQGRFQRRGRRRIHWHLSCQ